MIFLSVLFGCGSLKKPVPAQKVQESGPHISCLKKASYLKKLSSYGKKSKLKNLFQKRTASELCEDYIKVTGSLLNKHKGKVGILFEAREENVEIDKMILRGILSSSKKQNKNFFKVRKNSNNPREVLNSLSDFVFKDKIGALIVWGNEDLLSRVSSVQKQLRIPTIYLDKKEEIHQYAYQLFPNRQQYSQGVVKAMKDKKVKKLAVLTPESSLKSPFLNLLKKQIKKAGIEIVFDEVYVSSSKSSMEMACQKIFNINYSDRRSEYMAIYREEKRKAKRAGFKLNKKLVFLPAQVQYDAILIPDNFKIVNEFTRLFDYFKAPAIKLFGTHEWRSNELVNAPKKYIDGAVFVDYLGDKDNFPFEVETESIGIRENYKLMGYYSGYLAQEVVNGSGNKKDVRKKLSDYKIKDSFINNRAAFEKNRFNWPVFSFEVKDQKIQRLDPSELRTHLSAK